MDKLDNWRNKSFEDKFNMVDLDDMFEQHIVDKIKDMDGSNNSDLVKIITDLTEVLNGKGKGKGKGEKTKAKLLRKDQTNQKV